MLDFKIITPEKEIFSEAVEQVTFFTRDGEITVLPHHIPLVTILQPGELRYIKNGQEEVMAVATGFAEVRLDNSLIILADAAEHAKEIDETRAEKARQRALEAMEKARGEESVDYVALQAQLEKAMNRLRVKKKYKDVGR